VPWVLQNGVEGISGISVNLVGDDLSKLSGKIIGPPDTPYDSGMFELEIGKIFLKSSKTILKKYYQKKII